MHGVTVYLHPIPAGERGTHRQREQEAVAQIIRHAFSDAARLEHDPDGAPLLGGVEGVRISVSHSARMAAVAARSEGRLGIDIEHWREQLRTVGPRYLSNAEQENFTTEEALLKAWTSKESVFKAAGVPDLTLIDISLDPDLTRATISPLKARGAHRFSLHHLAGPEGAQITIAVPDA